MDANMMPKGGQVITATPADIHDNTPEVARAAMASRPKMMAKHTPITADQAQEETEYVLTIPNMAGWTFFLISDKPDKNTGCPNTVYPVEFGPGSTGFNDSGLANAILDNEGAHMLMESGDLVLTQRAGGKKLRHTTGQVLMDVNDPAIRESIEGSAYGVLNPKTLRTSYAASGDTSALKHKSTKVGKKGEAHGSLDSANPSDSNLLGNFVG